MTNDYWRDAPIELLEALAADRSLDRTEVRVTLQQTKLRMLQHALLNEEVFASLRERAIAGQLDPELELLLWQTVLTSAAAPVNKNSGRPTLAFRAPLSADEIDARRTAAALDGDVEQLAALEKERR